MNRQQLLIKLKSLIRDDGKIIDIIPFDKFKKNDNKYHFGKYNMVTGKLTKTFKVIENDNFKCVACGLKVTHFLIVTNGYTRNVRCYNIENEDNPILFTKDHIIPKFFNGNNQYFNLQCHCSVCNSTKSNNTSFEDVLSFHKNQNDFLEKENHDIKVENHELRQRSESHDILKKKYKKMERHFKKQLELMECLELLVNNSGSFSLGFKKKVKEIVLKYNNTLSE